MKPVEVQLLDALGGGVHPFEIPGAEIPAEGPNFDAMLQSAVNGHPKTELGILFAPSVSGSFMQSEQELIARGVDLAAAAGVDHALVLHDEQALRVDVRNRIVLDVAPVWDQRVIDGIDGFVSLKSNQKPAETNTSKPSAGTISPPARVVRNASLVHALAGRVPD